MSNDHKPTRAEGELVNKDVALPDSEDAEVRRERDDLEDALVETRVMSFEESMTRARAAHTAVKSFQQPGNNYALEHKCRCGAFVFDSRWKAHVLAEADKLREADPETHASTRERITQLEAERDTAEAQRDEAERQLKHARDQYHGSYSIVARRCDTAEAEAGRLRGVLENLAKKWRAIASHCPKHDHGRGSASAWTQAADQLEAALSPSDQGRACTCTAGPDSDPSVRIAQRKRCPVHGEDSV